MQKKIRKIMSITLIILLTLAVSGTGAFAWFNQKKGSEVQLNMRSRELFSPMMIITSNGERLDYNNQTKYDREKLEITLKKSDFTYQNNTYSIDFKTSINIQAYQNIYFKAKVNISIIKDGIVTPQTVEDSYGYEFATNQTIPFNPIKDSEGYHLYPNEIKKEENIALPFLDKLTITEPIADNSEIKIIILTKAIQSNRKNEVWNNYQEISFTQDFGNGNKQVRVILDNISNQQYTRGMVIEFLKQGSSYEKHTVFWRTIDDNTLKTVNLSGVYKMTVYATNFIKLKEPIPITIENGIINIHLEYQSAQQHWGYEDIIYSPSMIAIWSDQNVSYKVGDIVFYNDKYYKVLTNHTTSVNGGNKPGNVAVYSEIRNTYQSNNLYVKGSIIYFDGTFWKAKEDVWGSPAADDHQSAWESFGKSYVASQTYQAKSLVYLTVDNKKVWYIATGQTGAYQSPSADYPLTWKEINYEYNNTKRYAYKQGDVFYRTEGTEKIWYYKKSFDPTWNGLPAYTTVEDFNSAQWGILKSDEIYDAEKIYSTNYQVVLKDNKSYYRVNADNTHKTPGIDTGWNELTDEWRETNLYKTYDFVTYQGRTYIWLGLGTHDNRIVTERPSNFNDWHEVTEIWTAGNKYLEGDTVIYSGSLWQAKVNINTLIIPGSSTTHWKEYQIIYDPNRN